MKIEGKRVIITEATLADLDFMCEVESNKDIWIYEEHVSENNQELRDRFTKRINGDSYYDFIVTVQENNYTAPIGFISAWKYCEWRKSWEIGYGFLPQYQKKGYGLESVRLLVGYAFDELKAHKVVGMCNCENTGSKKIMSGCGMRLEGTFVEELDMYGKWIDQLYFSILESEYEKIKNN